jgi:hypothetical protein
VGNADDESAAVVLNVIKAIRDGDALGVGAEVVMEDSSLLLFPASAWVLEVAHQVALFGVDADDGEM